MIPQPTEDDLKRDAEADYYAVAAIHSAWIRRAVEAEAEVRRLKSDLDQHQELTQAMKDGAVERFTSLAVEARNAALEEAAKRCEDYDEEGHVQPISALGRWYALQIRFLKTKGETK